MTGKRWDAVYYDPSGVRYTSKVKVSEEQRRFE